MSARLKAAAILTLLGATTLVTTVAAGPASAQAGSWTKLNSGSVSISDVPSLYRSSDGTLHVLYIRHDQATDTDSLIHVPVSSNGKVGTASAVVSGWSALGLYPHTLPVPGGGYRVVFTGLHSTVTGDYYNGFMYDATSDSSASTWSLQHEVLGEGGAYSDYGNGATTLGDGTPVTSYILNGDVHIHVGIETDEDAMTDTEFDLSGSDGYDTTLVATPDDTVYLSYYAFDGGQVGTYVQQVYPTTGQPLRAPQSAVGNDSVQPGNEPTATTVRPDGTVWTAYCAAAKGSPDCAHIDLWKLGTTKPVVVPGSAGADHVSLSSGPGGRLWVAWLTGDGSHIKAVGTGASNQSFGPVHTLTLPHGHSPYDLQIAASNTGADIVVNTGSDGAQYGLFDTQVLPGLQLKASPTSWKHTKSKKVHFTVTDASTKVQGLTVKAGSGQKCTTNAQGTCSITFPKSKHPGTIGVTAAKTGYASGTVRVRET